MFDGKTEKFSTFFVCFFSTFDGWINETISEEAFFPLFFLKNSVFYILLKYLLVEGRTGMSPSTGSKDNLSSTFPALVDFSVLISRVIVLELISHPTIYLFFP